MNFATKVVDSPFAARVARVPSVTPVSVYEAMRIMGDNFIPLIKGLDDDLIKNHRPHSIMTSRGRVIGRNELEVSKKTHVLIQIPRDSVVALKKKLQALYRTPIIADDDWYEGEVWATREGVMGYHLIRKDLVAPGIAPDWQKQRNRLPEGEIVSPTRVRTHFLVRYYLATGLRLLPDSFARCSDMGSEGRGKVGYFRREGLRFAQGSVQEGHCNGLIGLAAEKAQ